MADDGAGQGTEEPRRSPSEQLLESLLNALLRRTQEGALAWEVDDGHPDSYCAAGEGWLVATRSVDGDGVEPFALVVAGASGEPFLELRSSRAYARPHRELFSQLHVAAAATAVIAERADELETILGELGQSGSRVDASPADRQGIADRGSQETAPLN